MNIKHFFLSLAIASLVTACGNNNDASTDGASPTESTEQSVAPTVSEEAAKAEETQSNSEAEVPQNTATEETVETVENNETSDNSESSGEKDDVVNEPEGEEPEKEA